MKPQDIDDMTVREISEYRVQMQQWQAEQKKREA